MRQDPVRPRKLGHAVLGTTDYATTSLFFAEGLGFKVSDRIVGVAAFLRCSTDHHNVLVLAAPVNFLHHTSWQVDDIDDVGRGAHAMLEGNPERHIWGLGRHYAGSNFFWYLKDPAGNFSEYYSDMDCIPEDQLWTPEDLEGARSLFAWGPPPPASFLHPDDLAAMMTGAHSHLPTRLPHASWAYGAEVRPGERSCVGWFRKHPSFCHLLGLGKAEPLGLAPPT